MVGRLPPVVPVGVGPLIHKEDDVKSTPDKVALAVVLTTDNIAVKAISSLDPLLKLMLVAVA